MFRLWPFGLLIALLIGYGHWREKRAKMKAGPLVTEISIRNPEQVKLLAFGDYGTGTQAQKDVFDLAETLCFEKNIDGVLLLGDNIYMDGVASVSDPKWKSIIENFFDRPCLSKIPRYPVLGNHDYKGNADAQIEYSRQNSQWYFPNRFYSIKLGKLVEIIALDTNYPDLCFSASDCVVDFLWQRLQESQARWKIALGHHPVVGSSSKHPISIQAKLFQPLLCQLDGYLAGHSHHLEHIKPNDCSGDFFISGAGGAELYPPEPGLETSRFAKASHGLLFLDIDASGIEYSFFDTDGKRLYRYSTQQFAQKSQAETDAY
ncbi:metallophosphoesterase [Pseudobacteriovorax antillogorgiicola]|uniref:Calcineurin-like phosphoesterase n=1 Tax=Pseudobacteriovorax antillogorgiicola TaxID=1513793 RepID=A0A1Y6BAI7_9BACT|nr:metallophosphoesterase [Pseudobacteriovorax antillogorgiicola]TCS58535.1 calcineurin-like phosphoesterase family protein [Pseudobacteriovorax antillogorgiicola]SME97858.1 Calcineurin-like phosphoesterase [Pseudobacteriovorax antillogorgiicola]